MPEGHVIHRLAQKQSQLLVGDQVIVESPQGRFEEEAAKISGRVLETIEPHGKHLFYHFANGKIVHVHLGLYGKYRHFDNPPEPPRGAVRLRVIGSRSGFDLNGPNRCRLVDVAEKQVVMNRLGEDPLHSSADPDKVWQKVKSSVKPIGSLLLDQSVIAGIGNIYRTEILFLLGVNPQTQSNRLTRNQFEELWTLTCELMSLGRDLNRIVTRRTSIRTASRGKTPRERFNIYKKPECPECGDSIYYWQLANRTVYACETCQKF